MEVCNTPINGKPVSSVLSCKKPLKINTMKTSQKSNFNRNALLTALCYEV